VKITHEQRVEQLVDRIGLEAHFPRAQLSLLKLFARFHDIGKTQIPLSILNKPGPLTTEEMNIMKQHSELGKELAEKLVLVSDFILKHHEHWDGTGYPLGLKGTEIPLECRILTILDAYDAMTHDRPYQKAISHEKAIQNIKDCSGTQFDPALVAMFCSLMEKSDDQTG
jgi:HD-GYP domain-containing protein (c-di-GMP phosphodiesterase class II)